MPEKEKIPPSLNESAYEDEEWYDEDMGNNDNDNDD